MDRAFAGKTALVTGGSRGIGRATALRLAREGADVALSYVSRRDDAQRVVQEIQALSRCAFAAPCDVSDPEEVANLVRLTRETHGPIDLLVHCGAISTLRAHSELTAASWQEMIDVNLTGTYNVVFAVKDEMIARRFGRIVTLSSVAALRPRKMQIHYSAAKAGVIAFTRCCAEAFAPYNVRINGVAPGLIETEMANVLPDETIRRVVADTPLNRLGAPEEVASVIRFLLSEESSFIIGDTLDVSGGRIMLP
jgi:3-oxoacyl-[acyl-carrier protein] reductase